MVEAITPLPKFLQAWALGEHFRSLFLLFLCPHSSHVCVFYVFMHVHFLGFEILLPF
jgi:hypothetical protein